MVRETVPSSNIHRLNPCDGPRVDPCQNALERDTEPLPAPGGAAGERSTCMYFSKGIREENIFPITLCVICNMAIGVTQKDRKMN